MEAIECFCTQSRAACPSPWQWNLGSLQPKPTSGKQLTRKSHTVSIQHFLSLHRACRRTAFVLLCHRLVLRSKHKINNFFSVSHTLSSKKFKVLLEQYPKPPSVVSFIAQGWELWPDGKVFALQKVYSEIQRKPIFYHCLPLCFDYEAAATPSAINVHWHPSAQQASLNWCCKGYEYKANTPGPQSSVRITIWHKQGE